MVMQATRKSGQRNQCLKVTCLAQVRESVTGVAEVTELLNGKQEEGALIVVIMLETVR